MSRPHVEFIQSQSLDWQPTPFAHLAGTQCKLLSRDAEEEFLVLEGELSLGALDYAADCYGRLPAYWTRGSLRVGKEAVLLCFFDRSPLATAGVDAREVEAARLAVPRLDAFEMGWESAGMDPAYADIGLRWKMLRGRIGDAQTTMLVACPPHLHPPRWRGPQEVHDCVEEMFLLSGDYLSNVGRMREGAYFWRPPGIAHGPYGTRHGNLALIRTIGAPLENNWTREEVAISRDPEARPFLPETLRARHARPAVPEAF